MKGSLFHQPKGIPPKKGHELVVREERDGMWSGHRLLLSGKCLISSVPQVSIALTVIEAGVDGLPLERAEQEEESDEGGTLGNISSPGSWLKGALQAT